MKALFAGLAALTFMPLSIWSADVPVTTLPLPHTPGPGERIWLEVKLGTLPRGHRVEISTDSGRLLGVISPFARQTKSQSEIYTVPVPQDAVSDNRISLQVVINDGKQKRPPRSGEIRTLAVKVTAASSSSKGGEQAGLPPSAI